MEGHSLDTSIDDKDIEMFSTEEVESDELSIAQFYFKENEPELVENDSNNRIINISSHSKESEKIVNYKRAILMARRKFKSFNLSPTDVNKKTGEVLNSHIVGKNIYPPDDDIETFIKMKFNEVNSDPSCSIVSPDQSCLMDTCEPSCSMVTSDPQMTYVPEASGSPKMSHSSSSTNKDLTSVDSEIEQELMHKFYNQVYLGEYERESVEQLSRKNFETKESFKASPLEECDLVQDTLSNFQLENSNESSESSEFEEDPDIINPNIMHNIELNEHFKYLGAIVDKIELSPDTPIMLDICMNLRPIPKIKHETQNFSVEERLNFKNGISEWEYDINYEDWNKIMVKRAAVFTTHAGFSIANEESLYVLAEVTTDYIKKLASIIKKNFDIQSSRNIDPIENSLKEIGIKGGIRELLKHYEDDIFGKRDKLTKKCQYLQKIIDQYVERMQLVTENSGTNDDKNRGFKSITRKTPKKIQSTSNDKTAEIPCSIKESSLLNYVVCPDFKVAKKNSDPEDTETNKTNKINLSDLSDEEIDRIDILKPLAITKPMDYNPERMICNVEERYLSVKRSESKNPNMFSTRAFQHTESNKLSPTLRDKGDDKNNQKSINLSEVNKIDKNTLDFCKMLNELGVDSKLKNANLVESDNALIDLTKESESEDDSVSIEEVLVHDTADHDVV